MSKPLFRLCILGRNKMMSIQGIPTTFRELLLGRNIPLFLTASVNTKLSIFSDHKFARFKRPFHQRSELESVHAADKDSGLTEKKKWDELPAGEIALWTILGWDRSSWNSGPPPASEGKMWAQLRVDEKEAAKKLKISMMIPPTHDPQWAKDSFDGAKHFDGSAKKWTEITEQQRGHWQVLGWVEKTWNNGLHHSIESCVESVPHQESQ
jgi:hypothetical protein